MITIDSPIKDLNIDPFKCTLQWERPIGSDSPYLISIKIYQQNAQTELHWNLTVEPAYIPTLLEASKPRGSNNIVLKGLIAAKQSGLKNLPVRIDIFNGAELLETRRTVSKNGKEFEYNVYPYIASNVDFIVVSGIIEGTSFSGPNTRERRQI